MVYEVCVSEVKKIPTHAFFSSYSVFFPVNLCGFFPTAYDEANHHLHTKPVVGLDLLNLILHVLLFM